MSRPKQEEYEEGLRILDLLQSSSDSDTDSINRAMSLLYEAGVAGNDYALFTLGEMHEVRVAACTTHYCRYCTEMAAFTLPSWRALLPTSFNSLETTYPEILQRLPIITKRQPIWATLPLKSQWHFSMIQAKALP